MISRARLAKVFGRKEGKEGQSESNSVATAGASPSSKSNRAGIGLLVLKEPLDQDGDCITEYPKEVDNAQGHA